MLREPHQDRRLPMIQALRGIAAILVVINHFARIFQNGGANASWIYESGLGNLGACGVDIFFVISGFIMIYTTRNKAGPLQAIIFFRKRIARIYPLYWVWTSALLLLWISGIAKLSSHNLHQHYSALYVIMSYLLIPYFNGDNFHPLLAQGWTLSFEMFFYLVLSCSIALRLTSRKLLFLLGAFSGLAALGNLLRVNNGLAYLFTSSIIVEFLYGVLAAELLGPINEQLARSHSSKLVSLSLMGVGGVALLCMVRLNVSDSWRFIIYGIPALFIVLGAAVAGSGSAPRLLAYLGDASYSIYLVHGFFAMAYASALKHFPRINTIPSDPAILILGAITITLSFVTYALVERPLTRLIPHKDRGVTNVKTAAANPRPQRAVVRKIV